MPPPEELTAAAVIKWIVLQILAALTLVVPTTWFVADYFYGAMGLIAANDARTTVLFMVSLGVVETLLFCPVMIIPVAIVLARVKFARQQLERLAATDALTGLLNRRGFEAAVAKLKAKMTRDSTAAALVCDIDYFKRANDQYGHEFGDRALRKLGAFIAEAVKPHEGVASRFGGEEFVVFLVGRSSNEVGILAESLRSGFQDLSVELDGARTNFTISIGVAFSTGPADLAPIIAHADDALYEAKRAGRNQVAIHASGTRMMAA